MKNFKIHLTHDINWRGAKRESILSATGGDSRFSQKVVKDKKKESSKTECRKFDSFAI